MKACKKSPQQKHNEKVKSCAKNFFKEHFIIYIEDEWNKYQEYWIDQDTITEKKIHQTCYNKLLRSIKKI